MNPVLVEATRGGVRESAHSGAVAVVDARGGVVVSLGDIDRPVFPRSAIKVLQALPLVASGAADRLGLDDEELAVACASHGGEPRHVEVVQRLLAKAGLDVDALECGTQWPYRETVQREMAAAGRQPSALTNNCSGKHAGFLGLACRMCEAGVGGGGGGIGGGGGGISGVDLRQYVKGYVGPDHPVMREVTAAVGAATSHDLGRAARGTDGCSIPTYAIPLRQLALAFARVATGDGLSPEHGRAASRLRAAVARHPFLVAGTGRFDTRVMERLGERVFCKVGAEGVYCAALPGRGLGVAIKVDDGQARGAEVAMAAVIEALVELKEDAERRFVAALSDVVMKNWNGIEVGRLRAVSELRAALGHRKSR